MADAQRARQRVGAGPAALRHPWGRASEHHCEHQLPCGDNSIILGGWRRFADSSVVSESVTKFSFQTGECSSGRGQFHDDDTEMSSVELTLAELGRQLEANGMTVTPTSS
jgi:hypothetical protein